ncbi:hypothetical protein ACFQ4H_05410 [Micromonospora sonneratiae]|uniref:Transposase n=2 Tax=Micromonospora sonneratiae TaxID=1184706 RepID=A0ABW3YBR2_9ACTN
MSAQGQPAPDTRDQGVRHMIAALDLTTGKLHYRIRDRKRWREFLSFLKTLRRRWPDQKLYLYASWLNWIEVEFAAVRYFTLNGTDHRSHHEQNTAIGDYIRWRNQHSRPKSGFAVNSKIRHPDYPFEAA